jgi:short-subunit dehydrogenase
VASLFAQIDGTIDVLVNNAGILEKDAPLHLQDPATWMKTWEVNINGTYLPTRAFLARRTDGVVINTSSAGALITWVICILFLTYVAWIFCLPVYQDCDQSHHRFSRQGIQRFKSLCLPSW